MERRVGKLELEATAGKIATTDGAGRRAWLEGSGLSLAFRLLEIQDEGGVIPDDLQREADLWSRAETEGHGQAAAMVKDLCIQIMMARGGMIDEGGH